MQASPVRTEPKTLTCALGHMWQTWVVTRAMASCLAATSSAVGDRARQKFTISAQAQSQRLSAYTAYMQSAHHDTMLVAVLKALQVHASLCTHFTLYTHVAMQVHPSRVCSILI